MSEDVRAAANRIVIVRLSFPAIFVGIALTLLISGAQAARKVHRQAKPAQLFVSTTGSDSGACTNSDPCATFNRAFHVAKPGQIVEVAAGTYPTQTILNDPTKTAPNVVIRPAQGAVVNIVGPAQGAAISLGVNSDDPKAAGPSYLTIQGVHAVGGLQQWTGSSKSARQAQSITLEDSSFTDVRSRIGPLITFRYTQGLKVLRNDIGPVCCGTDGLNLANAGAAGSDPSDVLIDHNYIHDITQTCATNPDPSCTNQNNCPANTKVCDHPDGSQMFGAQGLTISNNRYYNAGTQNIFLQTANGGRFSNITLENNMVSTSAGPGVTNSVSLGGPGRGVFSGFVRVINNTFEKNFTIYDTLASNRVLAPGTKVTIAGNIIGVVGDDSGSSRCSFIANDGSEITPTYSGNLFGNKTCAATDRLGHATFVSTNPLQPDLHLVRSSLGLGIGDRRLEPEVDIDGDLRPNLFRPDAGADQRDPASIRIANGIGAVHIGESESDVTSFYGAARPTAGLRFLLQRDGRAVVYRLHRGRLWLAYQNGTVVAVGTSSRFYRLSRLTAGARLGTARPLGRMAWVACRRAYAVGPRQANGTRLYVVPSSHRAAAHVTAIWLVAARSGSCS